VHKYAPGGGKKLERKRQEEGAGKIGFFGEVECEALGGFSFCSHRSTQRSLKVKHLDGLGSQLKSSTFKPRDYRHEKSSHAERFMCQTRALKKVLA
jgi:hypothetical protein